jgi:hypothetical protein
MRYAQVDGRQGRGNPPAFHTHRVQEEVFIDGLHTDSGSGGEFRGGIFWPIEQDDEPATTPSTASGWLIYAAIAALFLVFTLFVVRLGVPNWG